MRPAGLFFALILFSKIAIAQHGKIVIYDAKLVPVGQLKSNKGRLVLEDGKRKARSIPKNAHKAHTNLLKVRDFYSSKLNHNSWDNKGSDIVAMINVNKLLAPFDSNGMKQNASWFMNRKIFMFGAGTKKGLNNIVDALDVIAHEYTHAVIDATSKLNYTGQSGALHEHFGDVFGALVNMHYNSPSKPFLIGSSILGEKYSLESEGLRDMKNPEYGLIRQPSHMMDVEYGEFSKFNKKCKPNSSNDYCGVHIISGIPNKMAFMVLSQISLDEASKLFYNVMTKRLKANANFNDYRKAMMEECKILFPEVCEIVDNAFRKVGIY